MGENYWTEAAKAVAARYISRQARETMDSEEDEPSGSSKAPSASFLRFLEEMDSIGKTVRNPDTGRTVKVKSLKGPRGRKLQHRLYQNWLKAQEAQTDNPGKGTKAPAPKPEFEVKGDWDKSQVKAMFGRDLSPHDLGRLSGIGGLGKGYSVTVSSEGDDLVLRGQGPDMDDMERRITVQDGKPVIVNEQVILYDDAPKGLGTRMFHSQVEAARELGIRKIQTHAAKSAHMVGYYVWPRLGYIADLPEPALKKLWADVDAGKLPPLFYAALKVQDLMLSPEGRQWWKDNGVGIDATFDTQGKSWEILSAYMNAKKDKAAGQKKPEKSKGRDFRPGDVDEAALDKVWDSRRKNWDELARRYEKNESKKAVNRVVAAYIQKL